MPGGRLQGDRVVGICRLGCQQPHPAPKCMSDPRPSQAPVKGTNLRCKSLRGSSLTTSHGDPFLHRVTVRQGSTAAIPPRKDASNGGCEHPSHVVLHSVRLGRRAQLKALKGIGQPCPQREIKSTGDRHERPYLLASQMGKGKEAEGMQSG